MDSRFNHTHFSVNDTATTLGSINTSTQEKKLLARRSREYNLSDPTFCAIFEDLADTLRKELEEEKRIQNQAESSSSTRDNEEPKT